MEASNKRKKKNVIFAVATILVICLLVATPLLLENAQETGSRDASILSAKAEVGSLRKTLSGTGTITEQDAEDVSVPDGVKVTDYLVENGQFVKQGDPVATVDKVSVLETISSIRETMSELETEMETIRSGSEYTYISAPAGGRVKAVYATLGDSVQDVILKHGALAVLSLDGLMAVRFPAEGTVMIGQRVTVVLADGTEVAGRVETLVDGEATVTFSDEHGSIDETATVLNTSGQRAGSGSIYVHSAWKAMATRGTVQEIYVETDHVISIYGTMLVLNGTATGGNYEQLAATHRDYEDMMADLFQMVQDGVLKAPCDGCVSGVDEDILELLSAEKNSRPTLKLLSANSPPDRQETAYANVIGIVTDTSGTAILQAWSTEIEDYSDTAFLVTATESFTKKYTGSFAPAYRWAEKTTEREVYTPFTGDIFAGQTDYYERSETEDAGYGITTDLEPQPNKKYYIRTTETVTAGSWVQTEVRTGGIYAFAFDGSDRLMFLVELGYSSELPAAAEEMPGGETGGKPDGQSAGMPSGGGGTETMENSGGGGMEAAGNGAIGSQPADESDSTIETTTILSVTPHETVSVSITVDELDILYVHTGQAAQVTLDALPGQAFTGTITKVNTVASNEGGNSKYSATIELERNGYMLGGMNASANITIEEREDVLLIPSEALTEQNTRSYVYTAFDAKTKTLSSPVSVETGLSDGLKVQILSGLQEGDTVWYSYYDTLEIKGLSGNTPGGFPNP